MSNPELPLTRRQLHKLSEDIRKKQKEEKINLRRMSQLSVGNPSNDSKLMPILGNNLLFFYLITIKMLREFIRSTKE